MSLLKDKVAIITGGTSGIGYAAAKIMADQGAIVYACARHKKEFKEENIRYHYLDVTDAESCNQLYDDVIKEEGKICIC